MLFKRGSDSRFPLTYEQWVDDEGASWTVQDLEPEDDAAALRLFVEEFVCDEMLCMITGVSEDPTSVEGARKFWRDLVIPERMTIACYRKKEGQRRLVGLNGLLVKSRADPHVSLDEFEGKAWRPVVGSLTVVEGMKNLYDVMGVDKYLSGAGLFVDKQYRGRRIAARLLNAREPLCKHLGITTTATVFSGLSPKVAAKCGFTTLLEVSLKDMADAGLDFPRDSRTVNLMIKKY